MTLPKTTQLVKVPPIKSQGIKTKIVPLIMSSIQWDGEGRWIEPFLGSGVVVFNVQPKAALLTDSNIHIVNFYQSIQSGDINRHSVRSRLEHEGELLLLKGEEHYYAIRDRFNAAGDPLDFLFLNRACFNGVMRFNRSGRYNVPFCRKPDRFRPAYITKICNQVAWIENVLSSGDWTFRVSDWRSTVAEAGQTDFLYIDPPYVDRHTDYYNKWTTKDADELAERLGTITSGFAYSMWLGNQYRKNEHVSRWFGDYPMFTFEHFYHVGPTEALRNSMQEALIVSRSHVATAPHDADTLIQINLRHGESEPSDQGDLTLSDPPGNGLLERHDRAGFQIEVLP